MIPRKNKTTIFIYTLFALSAFFIVFQSCMLNALNNLWGFDAKIYSYIGWVMKNRGLPYVNAWDNKGPSLFCTIFGNDC